LLDAAASGDLAPAPPFETGKAQRKSLASTGYLVERFLAACHVLMLKVPQMSEVLPYFQGFDFSVSPMLENEGIFVCPVQANGNDLNLQPLLLSAPQVQQTITAWQQVQLDAPRNQPAILEIPDIANAPIWPALLHLRPLRPFWEQQLRRNHLESLMERVPHAWMLDPAPLPPGAVIPGLELASWQKLTPKNNFTIASTASAHTLRELNSTLSSREWKNIIEEALQSFASHPQVLQQSPAKPAVIYLGIYQRQNKRVDLLGGIAIHQDETTAWRLSRW
ncbi:MAG: hypothetical protein RL693_1619, partial [Verrucomicrobiota bacterium]